MSVKTKANNKQLNISKALDSPITYQYHPDHELAASRDNTLVFDNPDLRHGFVQVPAPVLKDKRLSGADKLLYALLLMYARQERRCFPGQDTLAADMGCTVKTMRNSMANLKEHKLIRVQRLGQGKVSIYHLRKLSDGFLPKQYVDGRRS